MNKYGFILLSLLMMSISSCVYEDGKIIVNLNPKKATLPVSVANVQIINHQFVITGNNLNQVSGFKIKENGVETTLQIESKNETSLVANTLSNVTLAAGKVYEFIFSNAYGAATFSVDFSLCNSNLNGAGFNCAVAATDKQVLSYDANTQQWKPRTINGLSYQGLFDASAAAPTSSGPSAVGDYFIISVAGNGYLVGDWAVDNGVAMERINNSTAITSVFGRTNAVVAQEGDYSLGQLGNVDTSGQSNGKVLMYNGTQWVPGTIASESDPTVSAFAKTTLPTCGSNEALKSNGSSFSCVSVVSSGAFSGTANRAVVTDGSGVLSVSSITSTVLGYLSGVTSNIQTQLDSKASSSAIVDWSAHSNTGPYIYPTRIYGGAVQASKTLVTDVTGNIVTSNVTPAELAYLSGATSNIQTQINGLSSPWTLASGDIYRTTGNVGIGGASPASKLQVTGAITNAVDTYVAAFTCGTTTLTFSGNFTVFSPSNTISAGTCNMALAGFVAGGSYTLVVKGNAATNAVTYAFSGYTFKYLPANSATTAGKDSIYTFLYDGSTVYVTWAGGY